MHSERYLKINIVILNIAAVLAVAFQMMRNSRITSLMFAVCLFETFFLSIPIFSKKSEPLNYLSIIVILLAFVSVLVSSILFNAAINLQYFKKWVFFSTTILYLNFSNSLKVDNDLKEIIFKLYFLFHIFIIGYYITHNESLYYNTNLGVMYLCFGFSNPNTASLFFSALAFGMILYLCKKDAFLIQFLKVLFFITDVFFIFKTQSRNAIIALFLFVFMVLIGRSGIFKKKFIIIVCSAFPLVFSYIYMNAVDLAMKKGWFASLTSEGKGLDSRVVVWKEAFQAFNQSPFFGSYGYMYNYMHHLQMHNTHIDVLVTFGIIVAVLFMIILYQCLYDLSKKTNSKYGHIIFVSFLSCIFLGLGEAALVSGGLTFFVFVGNFVLLRE